MPRPGYWSSRPGAGAERCREAIALLEDSDEPWWLGQAYWMLAYNLLTLSVHDDVLSALAQIDIVARRIGDTRLAAYGAWTAGFAHARSGEFTRGLETCRRARELATDPLHPAWSDVTLGVVYVEMGDAGHFRTGEQWSQLARAELDLAGVLQLPAAAPRRVSSPLRPDAGS